MRILEQSADREGVLVVDRLGDVARDAGTFAAGLRPVRANRIVRVVRTAGERFIVVRANRKIRRRIEVVRIFELRKAERLEERFFRAIYGCGNRCVRSERNRIAHECNGIEPGVTGIVDDPVRIILLVVCRDGVRETTERGRAEFGRRPIVRAAEVAVSNCVPIAIQELNRLIAVFAEAIDGIVDDVVCFHKRDIVVRIECCRIRAAETADGLLTLSDVRRVVREFAIGRGEAVLEAALMAVERRGRFDVEIAERRACAALDREVQDARTHVALRGIARTGDDLQRAEAREAAARGVVGEIRFLEIHAVELVADFV